MQCIYLFTPQEAEIGRYFQIEQFSGQLPGQFSYGVPCTKVSLVFGLSPSLCMITLSPLPLCSSRSHKYNNYDKGTYIIFSNLCLFTCPQAIDFYEIPTHKGILVQRVFVKFIPLFLVFTFQIIYQYPRPKSA